MPLSPHPHMEQSVPTNESRLLWDWPTRLLHWAMAGLFTGAFTIALLASEHSPTFVVHAALGVLLGGVVLVRLMWGLVGSQPSRIGSFLHSPMSLLRYVREALRGEDKPTAGHNPGSSYAIYAMLLLPLGLVGTGIAMGRGVEWAEEVHGTLAYGMVGVIMLHLLGLAWHTRRHREPIALSMIHGRRQMGEIGGIASARPLAGIAVALALGASATLIVIGLDAQKGTLTIPGLPQPLVLKGDEVGEGPRQDHASEEEQEGEHR